MNLKPDNIYVLPDGHELVARLGDHGGYLLVDPRRGVAAAPVYFVTSSGALLSWNRKAPWTLSDLRHTGRSIPPEIERLVML